jgi:hypothetical protein
LLNLVSVHKADVVVSWLSLLSTHKASIVVSLLNLVSVHKADVVVSKSEMRNSIILALFDSLVLEEKL